MKTIKFKKNHEVRKGFIFLVFAVLCNLAVSAQTTFTIGNLKYTTTTDSTVSVGKNGTPTGDLVIPESVEHEGTQYSVTSIGSSAFQSCKSLTSVTIPNSVTSIGNQAFWFCEGLSSVTIPNSVTSIGNYAFNNCSGLTAITIPNSVTSIGQSAFQSCKSLTSVTIPNSVMSIERNVFRICTSLTSIDIPNSVTSIGNYAFQDCTSLISVTIPNSVTSIGNSAFYYCKGLTSVTIPNSVTSIEGYVFGDCTGLTDIYCHIEEPLTINSSVFDKVQKNTCTLHVPIGSKEKYEVADVWKEFNIVEDLPTGIVSIDNSQLTIDNDVWYTLNGVRLNGKPTKAGVYIVNGKKVVIK